MGNNPEKIKIRQGNNTKFKAKLFPHVISKFGGVVNPISQGKVSFQVHKVR